MLAATGVRLAFNPVLGVEAPHMPFNLAVIIAAWFGGRGPGLVAAALSAFSVDWFFVEPLHSPFISSREGVWGLALFVITTSLVALLVGSLRALLLARARAEAILRRQAHLINLAHDAIITTDSDGRIVTWNNGAEKMYGWSESEAVGKTLHELLQTSGPISTTEIDATLRRERQWNGELSHTARDSQRLAVESRQVLILDYKNLPASILEINRDVTERKRAEERLRQAQKLESIGLLAGGIAHDFNNLLTVIIGNAGFALNKDPLSKELRQIISASDRAAHLTRQLLAYAGKGPFISKTFNLKDVVFGSAELLSVSIPKRVELRFNLSPEELLIKGDPSQIEQILMNLVVNAGEAIPPHSEGRIEVTTRDCGVIPETVLRDARVFDIQPGHFDCLEVTDDGTGMDEATLTRIFDPFFSTKFTGRGLGLAAVQGIVRGCHGFIDVHSSLGAGTTFRVFLPASDEKPATTIPAGTRPDNSRRGKLATILVVEDEEMVRKMVCTALRGQGHEVVEATSGKGALVLLAGAATLPTLVFTDLTMPVMGGAELVPILNRDYPGLRVIVTSGYPEEDARREFPTGAIADFLQKPYTLATLTEKVEGILNSGGPNEETPEVA